MERENLTEEEMQTLTVILNQIIPPSEDGIMPGASDVGFFAYLENEKLIQWIREGLFEIVEEARNNYNQDFSALDGAEQIKFIEMMRRKFFQFFTRFTTYVIQCYYQDDRVLAAIGLDARPPFPEGYIMEEGDLTLLEAVYLREKMYRK